MGRKEFENLVTDVSKKLADEGLLIKAGFIGFMVAVYGKDWARTLHSSKRRDVEMAFMGGAMHLFSSIMTVMDEGEEATEAHLRKLDMIATELKEYGDRFAASLPTQGRG